MWERLFATADTLQKGLSAAWTRNNVIQHNIANVETPGYKAYDYDFEAVFASSLTDTSGLKTKTSREGHIIFGRNSGNGLGIVQDKTESMRMDGNNVDIENENAKLAQNTIYQNAVLLKLNGELARLNMAITEGGR